MAAPRRVRIVDSTSRPLATLVPSSSLPVIRRHITPSAAGPLPPLPLPLQATQYDKPTSPQQQQRNHAWLLPKMGRRPVDKLVVDLQAYAHDEAKRRGVTKTVGFSESRLAIWREVLSAFADHMPSSHALLARIAQEYDDAIAAVRTDLEAAEARVASSWQLQKQAEAAASAARIDSDKRVAAAVDRNEAKHAALEQKREAAAKARREVEALIQSMNELVEAERTNFLRRAVEQLAPPKRKLLLTHWLRNLAAGERFAIVADLISGRPREAANEVITVGEVTGFASVEEAESAIESLLDALPKRLRSMLGVRAFRSTSTEARALALRELRDLLDFEGSTEPVLEPPAGDDEQLADARGFAESSRLEAVKLRKQVAQLQEALDAAAETNRKNAAELEALRASKSNGVASPRKSKARSPSPNPSPERHSPVPKQA